MATQPEQNPAILSIVKPGMPFAKLPEFRRGHYRFYGDERCSSTKRLLVNEIYCRMKGHEAERLFEHYSIEYERDYIEAIWEKRLEDAKRPGFTDLSFCYDKAETMDIDQFASFLKEDKFRSMSVDKSPNPICDLIMDGAYMYKQGKEHLEEKAKDKEYLVSLAADVEQLERIIGIGEVYREKFRMGLKEELESDLDGMAFVKTIPKLKRYYNMFQMISELVGMGKSACIPMTHGWTPLHLLCQFAGSGEFGCEFTVGSQTVYGDSPLLLTLKLLLEKGARMDVTDIDGDTPLCYFLKRHRKDFCLIYHSMKDTEFEYKERGWKGNFIHHHIRHRNYEAVEEIYDFFQYQSNAKDCYDQTPLHVAAEMDNGLFPIAPGEKTMFSTIVKILDSRFSLPHSCNMSGDEYTFLHILCKKAVPNEPGESDDEKRAHELYIDNVEGMFRALRYHEERLLPKLREYAKKDIYFDMWMRKHDWGERGDSIQYLASTYAERFTDTDAASVLEEASKDTSYMMKIIKSQDYLGNTALHYALLHGNWPMAKRLCKECPQLLRIENREGRTPLTEYKEKYGSEKTANAKAILNIAGSGNK